VRLETRAQGAWNPSEATALLSLAESTACMVRTYVPKVWRQLNFIVVSNALHAVGVHFVQWASISCSERTTWTSKLYTAYGGHEEPYSIQAVHAVVVRATGHRAPDEVRARWMHNTDVHQAARGSRTKPSPRRSRGTYIHSKGPSRVQVVTIRLRLYTPPVSHSVSQYTTPGARYTGRRSSLLD
jgi:hypothetical protein